MSYVSDKKRQWINVQAFLYTWGIYTDITRTQTPCEFCNTSIPLTDKALSFATNLIPYKIYPNLTEHNLGHIVKMEIILQNIGNSLRHDIMYGVIMLFSSHVPQSLLTDRQKLTISA